MTLKVFFIALLFSLWINISAASDGEFCYESKCWQYENVADVQVGGMRLPEGEYVRVDKTTNIARDKKEKNTRVTTMVLNKEKITVELFSFPDAFPHKSTEFSFSYDRVNNRVITEETAVGDRSKAQEERIIQSIPEIAGDLFKNNGYYSSGESIELDKSIRIRGDHIDVRNLLTLLGKVRYQGENMILLRSTYTFEVDSVLGSADGYIMQNADTSMPRYTAHTVELNFGDQLKTIKIKGLQIFSQSRINLAVFTKSVGLWTPK